MVIKRGGIQLQVLMVLLVFQGCSTLGSSANVENPDALARVRKICLSPIYTIYLHQHARMEIRAYVYDVLRQALDSADVLPMVYNDTLRKADPPVSVRQAVRVARAMHCDGVLFAEIRIERGWLTPAVNADITLTLAESQGGDIIATSHHGTSFGNSYFEAPSLHELTRDAVNGAVRALQNELRSLPTLR